MDNCELTKKPNLDIFNHQFPARLKEAEIYDPTKFTILTGSDGILDDLFSYQVYNKIKNNWRAAAAPADKQPGMIRSDSDDDKLHHYGAAAWEEILQVTRSSDVIPHFDAVRIRDTGLDHYLELRCNENLTGGRILNLIVGNVARTVTLSGNPTLADWFDQAVKIASSPTHANLYLGEYLYHLGDVDTYIRFQTDNITLRAGGIDFINMVEAATDYLQLLTGLNFIGDTLNADMTVGLTINQAGNDDEILALKSSDVGHGVTDIAETDTFSCLKKGSAAEGGLLIDAITEGNYAFYPRAIVTTDNTDHDATALAPFVFQASKKSGTGIGAMGADANLAVFRNHLSGCWVLDEDGDTWQAGMLTAKGLIFGTPSDLTIAGGAITVTGSYHLVIGQGDAADNLDNINGGVDGQILVLQAKNGATTITVRDNGASGGNIYLEANANQLLDDVEDKIYLFYDGTNSIWTEISRFTG